MQNRDKIFEKFKARNKKENQNWQTYNDQLNTILFDREGLEISRKDLITLEDDELPLLECNLPNDNYFLMTTHKVYSYFWHYLKKRKYEGIEGFHPSTFFFKDPALGNKTELYALQYTNKSLLFYEIDSGDPGYYAIELFRAILNRPGNIKISLKKNAK